MEADHNRGDFDGKGEIIDFTTFECWYSAYSPKMYAVCFRYSKNAVLSEDVIQEVFLSLWERRSSLSIKGNIENYLVRAAKLKMLESCRNDKRRRQLFEQIVHSAETVNNIAENNMAYKELHSKVLETVAQMPEREKQAFVLCQQPEYDNHKIAAALQMNKRTVDNYLSKAAKKVRYSILHALFTLF